MRDCGCVCACVSAFATGSGRAMIVLRSVVSSSVKSTNSALLAFWRIRSEVWDQIVMLDLFSKSVYVCVCMCVLLRLAYYMFTIRVCINSYADKPNGQLIFWLKDIFIFVAKQCQTALIVTLVQVYVHIQVCRNICTSMYALATYKD